MTCRSAASISYLAACYPEEYSALGSLAPDALAVVRDGMRVLERGKNYHSELSEDVEPLIERGRPLRRVCFSCAHTGVAQPPPRGLPRAAARRAADLARSARAARAAQHERALAAELRRQPARPPRVIWSGILAQAAACSFSAATKRARRISSAFWKSGTSARSSTLKNDRLPRPARDRHRPRRAERGQRIPQLKLVILTEGQLRLPSPASEQRQSPRRRPPAREALRSYEDLSGDLVVHEHHGIGRYRRASSGCAWTASTRTTLKSAYRGQRTACMSPRRSSIMVSQIHRRPRRGRGSPSARKAQKLGGTDWCAEDKGPRKGRGKGPCRRASSSSTPSASAARASPSRPDSPWQTEFEDSLRLRRDATISCAAIAEIKARHGVAAPMDRLLCGDVGFGKTEVALRAVMKCVLDGKQVGHPSADDRARPAALHDGHATASAAFPVHIDVLSRFRTAGADRNSSCRRSRTGKIDLIVGTHKLLQKDVHFKDLGLLIVDEEQRFGVTHKEKLKELSARRGRADAVGNAHPAHAQHGAVGHPRHVHHRGRRRRTATRCRPSCSSIRTA